VMLDEGKQDAIGLTRGKLRIRPLEERRHRPAGLCTPVAINRTIVAFDSG